MRCRWHARSGVRHPHVVESRNARRGHSWVSRGLRRRSPSDEMRAFIHFQRPSTQVRSQHSQCRARSLASPTRSPRRVALPRGAAPRRARGWGGFTAGTVHRLSRVGSCACTGPVPASFTLGRWCVHTPRAPRLAGVRVFSLASARARCVGHARTPAHPECTAGSGGVKSPPLSRAGCLAGFFAALRLPPASPVRHPTLRALNEWMSKRGVRVAFAGAYLTRHCLCS